MASINRYLPQCLLTRSPQHHAYPKKKVSTRFHTHLLLLQIAGNHALCMFKRCTYFRAQLCSPLQIVRSSKLFQSSHFSILKTKCQIPIRPQLNVTLMQSNQSSKGQRFDSPSSPHRHSPSLCSLILFYQLETQQVHRQISICKKSREEVCLVQENNLSIPK
eukprot:c2501_g1_i1 orf=715-1200(+)